MVLKYVLLLLIVVYICCTIYLANTDNSMSGVFFCLHFSGDYEVPRLYFPIYEYLCAFKQ
jgi:hypothetical protein